MSNQLVYHALSASEYSAKACNSYSSPDLTVSLTCLIMIVKLIKKIDDSEDSDLNDSKVILESLKGPERGREEILIKEGHYVLDKHDAYYWGRIVSEKLRRKIVDHLERNNDLYISYSQDEELITGKIKKIATKKSERLKNKEITSILSQKSTNLKSKAMARRYCLSRVNKIQSNR